MPYRGDIGALSVTGREADRVSVEWVIPGFLSLDAERGDDYGSTFFDACGGRWRLSIFPNGMSEWPSGLCALILLRYDDVSVQTFILTAGIRGMEGRRITVTKEMSSEYRGCFWIPFCRRSELKDGESLVITLDVMIHEPRDSSTQTEEELRLTTVPTEVRQDSSTQMEEELRLTTVPTEVRQGVEDLLKCFHRLFESKRETDVIINVQGKEFPAHRLMLQARSPVFEAMFSHDMVEKQSGVVKMEDCDPDTFPDFLLHVYTGSVDMISTSNVFNLFTASDKYDLAILKQECSEFLKNNVTVASFCKTIALGLRHDDRALIERATEFFCKNSMDIVKTAEWQIFMVENATVANELFIKVLSKRDCIFCRK